MENTLVNVPASSLGDWLFSIVSNGIDVADANDDDDMTISTMREKVTGMILSMMPIMLTFISSNDYYLNELLHWLLIYVEGPNLLTRDGCKMAYERSKMSRGKRGERSGIDISVPLLARVSLQK